MGDARQSTFERIGGAEAVDRLVDDFYARVLSDPELGPFFAHTDMAKLRRMQVEFFASALGGPTTYAGMTLADAHRGRGIQPRHLTRFVEHLLATLQDQGLDDDDVDAIVDHVNTVAGEITGQVGEDG